MSPVPPDFAYELLLRDTGTAILTNGGEVMWSSDDDEEFSEWFDEDIIESADLPEVIEWLQDEGYLPDGLTPDIVDESTPVVADEDFDDSDDDEDEWDDEDDENDGSE